jgi:CubicO group peptidase (beta-lactamase class C family)
VAILKLVEQGKIDLDAEVQTYVPYFPRKPQRVTVRQLLGHLGGISHYRNYNAEGRIKEPKNTRESIAIFQDFDLVSEPGTRYFYSSYGYNLLGAVVEAASGRSYGDFMRDEVWGPLGMTSTRMDDPREIIPNRVRGYELAGKGVRNSEFVDISSRFAAGGTRSTVTDLIRFMRGVADGKVLKPETVDLMWTSLSTRDGTETQYGLGWNVDPESGRFTVAHGGSQQETRTSIIYLPRRRFGIALASNLEEASLAEFANRLALIFLGDSWNIGPYVSSREDQETLGKLDLAYLRGLAYYDRYGRPMTTDRKQLAESFRIIGAGAASYMAAELAGSGADLEKYHREGELSFFNDYIELYRRNRSIRHRFAPALEKSIQRWSADWNRIWTAELKRLMVREIAASPDRGRQLRTLFAGSSIVPDYSRGLVRAAETAARSGDSAEAVRLSTLALELYPESERANGLAGVLAVLGGHGERGRALLRKSLELAPTGYASARNLRSIANAVGPEQARVLLAVSAELHPEPK